MTSMRLIAIFLNVALIGTVIYLVSQQSSLTGIDIANTALFLSAPMASLAVFCFSNSESWLSLYFKRKTLEEKAKIDRLNEKPA